MPLHLQAIFTSYKFHFPLTVALLQMAFISPVSYLVAKPVLSFEHLRGIAPLAFVNVLNVVCGLIGTAGLNVPMFIALRRFTLLFTILLERYWLKKTHDWPTLGAMGIMIGGAIMAAATDMTFNPRGYMAVLANDVLTSLYLIMVKNTPSSNGLSTTGERARERAELGGLQSQAAWGCRYRVCCPARAPPALGARVQTHDSAGTKSRQPCLCACWHQCHKRLIAVWRWGTSP
jgi:hypothetical protein